jgi:hypothetical protein
VEYRWTCACCNKQFDSLPLDYGFRAPDHWLALSDEERQKLGRITDDVCLIDTEEGRQIFIRGCLEIPIVDHDDLFTWGVWTSVSEKSYARILELWNSPVSEDEPPLFGWLCNNISQYPDTLSLKTNLHLRDHGLRPAITLSRTDHPLYLQQRDGITLEQVAKIAAGAGLH